MGGGRWGGVKGWIVELKGGRSSWMEVARKKVKDRRGWGELEIVAIEREREGWEEGHRG